MSGSKFEDFLLKAWVEARSIFKKIIKLEENRCSPNAYTFYKNNLKQIRRAPARRKLLSVKKVLVHIKEVSISFELFFVFPFRCEQFYSTNTFALYYSPKKLYFFFYVTALRFVDKYIYIVMRFEIRRDMIKKNNKKTGYNHI